MMSSVESEPSFSLRMPFFFAYELTACVTALTEAVGCIPPSIVLMLLAYA